MRGSTAARFEEDYHAFETKFMACARRAFPNSGLAGAQDTTAKIHGHVQDPANAPIANGQVILSTDGKTALYTFTTDANGDYKGEGINPGPTTSRCMPLRERRLTASTT